MAEFDCFCTAEEFVALLTDLLGKGYSIQLDKNLAQPVAEFCTTPEEVRAAFDRHHYAYLLGHSGFTKYATNLRQIERSGRKCWYPRAKEGGPVIEAYFVAPFERESRRVVACTLIAYQAKVINPATDELEPAGEAVKVAFTDLVAGLRERSRRVRSKSRTAFVTPGVDEMLAAGWSLAPPFADTANH